MYIKYTKQNPIYKLDCKFKVFDYHLQVNRGVNPEYKL